MSDKKKRKKKYFPNNYTGIAAAPSEWFDSIPYDEFMDWKTAGWELPSSVNCIIREHNLKTGKVKEYVYQRIISARKKASQIMAEGESSITVCEADSIHYLYPEEVEEYDDPLT